MGSLAMKIEEEVKNLPPKYLKEVLDFIAFVKQKARKESDTKYLSKNEKLKKSIIEGLKTPLTECSDKLIGDV